DLGFVHETEELASVTAETLDVAPLPFGVDRVKSKATLAATRDASHDDKLVLGNIKVNILEVMLAGTANFYIVHKLDSPLSSRSLSRTWIASSNCISLANFFMSRSNLLIQRVLSRGVSAAVSRVSEA